MLTITDIRHAWPAKAGFCLNRLNGRPDYTFVHFISSVEIRLNGVTHIAPGHSCIIYRPGTPQQFTSHGPLLHDWFHFTGIPEPMLEALQLPLDNLFYPAHSEFITGIVQDMEREFFADQALQLEIIDLKIAELFLKLSRALYFESTPVIDSRTTQHLRKLRGDIMESLDHSWTVAEMASRIPLSESRFAHVYKSFYGTSPMDDLIRARIDSAKNTLLFTDKSVSYIAETLGYSNVTHFIRQFRTFTGMSPAKYRKNNGNPTLSARA